MRIVPRRILAAAAGCWVAVAAAQSPEPEVRRAIPVGPVPTPTPAADPQVPAWMERVPEMLRARRADEERAAAAEAPPRDNPPQEQEVEVRRALPAQPSLQPAPPAPDAAPGGDIEEIRAAPTVPVVDPAMGVLERANAFYARKLHDLAVPEYERYLEMHASGPNRQAALFRLAESQRALGRNAAAQQNYEALLMEFGTGDFVGPTSYRLGELYFSAASYDLAAKQFDRAARYVKDPKLKLAARFYEARSHEGSGRRIDALNAYRAVAAVTEDNPYRDMALMHVAEGDAAAGLRDSALRQFEELAKKAENPTLRASAGVKGGLIALDLKEDARARALLDAVAGMQEMGEWRTAARLALLRADYESGRYAEAAARAESLLPSLPDESRPEALLVFANAQRQLGRHEEALALYRRLIAEHPDHAAARDARFHQLVSMVAQKDPGTLAAIDAFLAGAPEQADKARAELLKAELLFGEGRYDEAAPLYESASATAANEQHRAEALYKLAWCRMQSKQYDGAIQSLTRFLILHPSHPLAPAALAQRAVAQMQTGQPGAAIQDFEAIIHSYPKAKERETAMQQRALLLGQQKRNAEMIAAFERLLAEYPDTPAAAQANFWIGYAAFDAGKYPQAIAALEKARRADPEQYGERATLRLLLAHYYQQDRRAAEAEARRLGGDKTPVEIQRWIGMQALQAGDAAVAVEFLAPAGAAPDAPDDVRLALADAQLRQKQYEAARRTLEALLPGLPDPRAKAEVHLLLVDAMLGMAQPEPARRHAEEALLLQPEGKINARARLANGRALEAQKKYDEAARAFMSVALLYEDAELTPRALQLASRAYRNAGNAADAERATEELRRRFPDYQGAPAS